MKVNRYFEKRVGGTRQYCPGKALPDTFAVIKAADVNGDGRIGLEEALYALRKTAGLL